MEGFLLSASHRYRIPSMCPLQTHGDRRPWNRPLAPTSTLMARRRNLPQDERLWQGQSPLVSLIHKIWFLVRGKSYTNMNGSRILFIFPSQRPRRRSHLPCSACTYLKSFVSHHLIQHFSRLFHQMEHIRSLGGSSRLGQSPSTITAMAISSKRRGKLV